jgi:RHS repeat-associated protein
LYCHLGSTVQVTRSGAAFVANQGYRGYGKYRLGGTLPTDHRYTGQKLDGTGLMYYGARYYDRQVGTFISPRPAGPRLVPDPTNVWDYNRFLYARGNPVKYNDPTGHCVFGLDTIVCVVVAAAVVGGTANAAGNAGSQIYQIGILIEQC